MYHLYCNWAIDRYLNKLNIHSWSRVMKIFFPDRQKRISFPIYDLNKSRPSDFCRDLFSW